MKPNQNIRRVLTALSAMILITLLACTPSTQPTPVPTPVTGAGGGGGAATPTLVAGSPENDLLVFVPGGVTTMGSLIATSGDAIPAHQVSLAGFWIYKTEVTNRMYQDCVEAENCSVPTEFEGALPYDDPSISDHPVVGVTYSQAQAYCASVQARLPTEAEWEKAARGWEAFTYPWGEDAPACDKANFADCALGGPASVGSYPAGASPYELLDMAGNVREWVNDWYAGDYYLTARRNNPGGPDGGTSRVVRGGGFASTAEELQTTARDFEDPETGYPDVGFRCVPIGTLRAPFCRSAYVPFCSPPDRTDGCVPGEVPSTGLQGENPLTITGIGCPRGNEIGFYIEVTGGATEGFTASVNGEDYSCSPVSGFLNRLYCTGPAQASGEPISITICRPAGVTGTPGFMQPGSGLALAAYSVPRPLEQTAPGDGVDDYCPIGYIYNPLTGQCERDPSADCPPGWTTTTAAAGCYPDQAEDCPPTTTYSAALQGCTPNDGGTCPAGYTFNDAGICQPDTNSDGGLCPQGYFFNRLINCCSPSQGGNYGCSDGYYFDQNLGRCIPTDQGGCGQGYRYDAYLGCIPDYDDSTTPGDDNCYPTTALAADGITCLPDDPNDGDYPCRQGTHLDDSGACVPDDTGDCGPNAYVGALVETCIETGDDGCPDGYFMNNAGQCQPTDGPGSPCGLGYRFDQRLNCCVPIPGNDGSTCPDGEIAGYPGGEAVGPYDNIPGVGALLPAGPYVQTAAGGDNYDPFTGYCFPEGDNPCPPGKEMNDAGVCVPVGYPNGCPQGTTPNAYDPTLCDPYPGAGCPVGTILDTALQTCVPVGTGETLVAAVGVCGENQYFNPNLGYCISRGPDCCALGYAFNQRLGYCAPVQTGTPGTSGQCPLYYRWDGQMCVPINGYDSKGCITINTQMPICDGPCLYPLAYDPATGQCVQPGTGPGDEEPDPCASNPTDDACILAGCVPIYSSGNKVYIACRSQ